MPEDETQDGWYSDDMATFGDRLAAARESVGMSVEDVAKRLGVKPATIAAWEEDRKEPRANRLTILAGMMGISLSWLMTGVGEGPEGGDEAPDVTPEVSDLLAQMRATRAQIARGTDQLARLEKQLRKALTVAA
ncbi:multiprotein-bridging factor 1 family protein [Yoonia sp. R2331]|uniref:helix-turn-helix domain-containing protein n=1 Tax=Yoonia sp. R2331 TaxID=3237238 RepID=UPI0034E58C8A